jgi:hypothetical protein
MDDKVAIPLIGSALLGAAAWFSRKSEGITEAQKRLLEQLLKQDCTVCFEPIGYGDVAIKRECPRRH